MALRFFPLLLSGLLSLAFAAGNATSFPRPPVPPHDPIAAAQGLITRLLGSRYVAAFQLELIPADPSTGRDVFEIDSSGVTSPVVALRGNNGVALASALSWYLRYYLNASVSWGRNGSGNQLTTVGDPASFPRPASVLRQVTPNVWRTYQNVCTAGYSLVWWTWEEWQAEIDRMALNGVNAPLAFTGAEWIFSQFFQQLGVAEEDLHFAGAAFLPWNRMNNMQTWGGPLSDSWIAQQRDLQLQILQRMRSFGMAPVLPGWSGRAPAAIQKVLPSIKLFSLPAWATFNSTFSSSTNVDPTDPLFVSLGVNYTRLLVQEYGLPGTSNVFLADLFNEMDPSSDDPSYLQEANAAMVAAIQGADKGGIYVMQGWLFRYSDFWQGPQGFANAKAFISGLPINASVILDLNTDQYPVWQNYESFFGRAWIWNTLAVFGGRRGLYGSLDRISSGPVTDRANSSSMVGFGATPEAIEEIPLFFDLVWEMMWRNEAPGSLDDWIVRFAQRRYAYRPQQVSLSSLSSSAAAAPLLPQAMTTLRQAVYDSSNMDETPLENTPSFTAFSSRNTNATGVLVALRLFLQSALNKEVNSSLSTWQYDCVDLVRQALVNLWDDLHHFQALAYQPFITFGADTSADVVPLTYRMLNLTADLDRLLYTNENYLLGSWIEDARSWAMNGTQADADLLELNARNQLTLWGPGAPLNETIAGGFSNSINDYAAKHWQGLVGSYYLPRWQLQSQFVLQSLASRTQANWYQFQEQHLQLEQAFTYQTTADASFPSQPSGESCLDVAAALIDDYAGDGTLGPVQDDYVIFENTDAASGNDIFQAWHADPSFLAKLCSLAPSCGGFNSGGRLKPSGTLNWTKPVNGSTLYVKKSQASEIKGGVSAPASVGGGPGPSSAIPGLLLQHCQGLDYEACLEKANSYHASVQHGGKNGRMKPFRSLDLKDAMPV